MTAAGLPGPGGLAPGACAPIDGILENRGNRAAVLRCDEQQGVRILDCRLEASDSLRDRLFEILIVHRQIVDLDEICIECIAAEPRQGLRQSAVDRFAPVAADDDAKLEPRHGNPYCWLLLVTEAT